MAETAHTEEIWFPFPEGRSRTVQAGIVTVEAETTNAGEQPLTEIGLLFAAADVDAGLCCLATGAPSCVQVCAFPCTLCLTGGACSHVYQGINYAGTVGPCP